MVVTARGSITLVLANIVSKTNLKKIITEAASCLTYKREVCQMKRPLSFGANFGGSAVARSAVVYICSY